MKIRIDERSKEVFKPFDLTITVESQEDLNSLFARFNCDRAIQDAAYDKTIKVDDSWEIYDILKEKCKQFI